jgi:conjugative transfer region lipoprotein (TIGR03751 family)
VFPHVALIGDEQLIKPGYTTAFFLYKQNQFALASERY